MHLNNNKKLYRRSSAIFDIGMIDLLGFCMASNFSQFLSIPHFPADSTVIINIRYRRPNNPQPIASVTAYDHEIRYDTPPGVSTMPPDQRVVTETLCHTGVTVYQAF
jgi:hypothetical protein